MDSYDTGRVIYLVLLVTVVGGYFFISHRDRLGEMMRLGLLWGLIFLGVVAAYGLWTDIRDDVMPRQTVFDEEARIEVPRAPDGHYYLSVRINGTSVPFVVDTGATDIVLSQKDAARVGINPAALDYTGLAGTANGMVRTARVYVDEVAIGSIVDRDVALSVNQGDLDTSLLGMTYLQRYSRLEISGGKLVLER